ncbi:MAG TPA: phosphoribosylamine--glycine ligase [Bacteroidales bacterium]|nr:phosphoribosylamine--glycine ligase [Bacteroidales bacterium]HSA43515.1 phosphoribosylamine--glycine ligase [Bacteroidales bacterium]
MMDRNNKQLNVLILGSGGREHALAWKISQSPLLSKLYTAPGNAGTATHGCNLPVKETDFEGIRQAVLQYHIDLVVVGPEAPLVKGISDFFSEDPQLSSIPLIGPSAKAAMLEGSKHFAKNFMQKYHIPTAPYRAFHIGQKQEALDFLQTLSPPYVIKADGLAAGKGVLICMESAEAEAAVHAMLEKHQFGSAGDTIVIESFLSGVELSAFVLTDGNHWILLPEAKDYKRIGENDQGPNTGGMGAISPVPFADNEFIHRIEEKIIRPTIRGLQAEGIPYNGFIFFGLMKCGDEPYVIEYNVRLGDPETESIMPRIQSDLLDMLLAVSRNELASKTLNISPDASCCVMMVAPGYPGDYPKDLPISGLDTVTDVFPFHAGTRRDESGRLLSNGGRILGITAVAENHRKALEKVYRACESIGYDGKYYRTDLGNDILI